MEPRSFKRGNDEVADVREHAGDASMEPRSFKRGNEVIAPASDFVGRSFNGATFIQTWKHVAGGFAYVVGFALQWSHVHSNVETRTAKKEKRAMTSASMEPRSFKRGNRQRRRARVGRWMASMEPRSFKRGNLSLSNPPLTSARMLQWSHVHSNVETDIR